MFLDSAWARNINNIAEMIDEIKKRQIPPIDCGHELFQTIDENAVESHLKTIQRDLADQYVDIMFQIAASFDEHENRSSDKYSRLSYVKDGKLTFPFLRGLHAVRRFMGPTEIEARLDAERDALARWKSRRSR